MAYAHQDWKPVIIHRELTKEESIKKGLFVTESKHTGVATINKQSKTDISMRKIEQDDGFKPATVSHSLALQIQKARTEKKMTQKELATKSMVPLATIQAYESINSAGVIVESAVLQKLSKILGVILKKPAKPKQIKGDAEKKRK